MTNSRGNDESLTRIARALDDAVMASIQVQGVLGATMLGELTAVAAGFRQRFPEHWERRRNASGRAAEALPPSDDLMCATG